MRKKSQVAGVHGSLFILVAVALLLVTAVRGVVVVDVVLFGWFDLWFR